MQRLVGDNPLQSSILVLERPHFRDVADFHAAKLGFPLVERRLADAVPAADVLGRLAALLLFEDADDLSFGEPGLSHGAVSREALPQDSAPILGAIFELPVNSCIRAEC
jgi:hypothetical protein